MAEQNLVVEIHDLQKDVNSLEGRVSKCEDSLSLLQEMNMNINKLAIHMDSVITELKMQSTRISTLEQEPVKAVKEIRKAFISAIVSGLVGLIIGAITTILIGK